VPRSLRLSSREPPVPLTSCSSTSPRPGWIRTSSPQPPSSVLQDALEELSVRLERSKGSRDGALLLLQVPERTDQLTAIVYAPQEGLVVKVDREQLTKAIAYLVRFLANRVDPDGRVAIHLQTVPDDPNRVRLSLVGRPAQLSTLEREHDPAAGRIGPASCATRLRPVPGRS
jgi:hypothetical protein